MKGVQATVGSVLAALAGLAQANSDIVSLYTSGSAYITEASATLVLPKLVRRCCHLERNYDGEPGLVPSGVHFQLAFWVKRQ